MRMVGRYTAGIYPDEFIQRTVYQGNNARLDHVICPASADDWCPRHAGSGGGIDQHITSRDASQLRFGCNASPLPYGISRRLDLKRVAEDKNLHSDLNAKRRIG